MADSDDQVSRREARSIALVTGATGAIGKAIATRIALETSYEVVLLCRNASKGQAAVDEIQRQTGNARVRYEVADLARSGSIAALAACSLFEQGASAEEIALRYSVLDLHDVYATLSYYLGQRQEMEEYLDRARQASVGARRDAERRLPVPQIRERLERYRTRTKDQPAG